MKKVDPMIRPKSTSPAVQIFRSMNGTEDESHPVIRERLTSRQLQGPAMSGRFGFPFPDHLSNFVHFHVFFLFF